MSGTSILSTGTSLHEAAYSDDPRVVLVLLEYGADVRVKDDYGRTPLDIARHHKNSAVINWLEKEKARLASLERAQMEAQTRRGKLWGIIPRVRRRGRMLSFS
jgi:ankyrin repeat protein